MPVLHTLWETINTPRFEAMEYIARRKKVMPQIVNPLETLQHVAEGASLARFGDSEFNLILRNEIVEQKNEEQLRMRLISILNGTDSAPNFYAGIPYVMNSLEGFTEESKKFWIKYFACYRSEIYNYLNFDMQYFDSQITRFWINRKNEDYSKLLFSAWKNIWDKKKILLVEGKHSRFGAGNDLFNNAKEVKRILCPSQNAFSCFDSIKAETLRLASNFDIVLIVLGPTATVLACDLAKEGLWVVDSGNMDMEYEWYRLKTKQKIKINNKSSIEMENGTEVGDYDDQTYVSQIIAEIY